MNLRWYCFIQLLSTLIITCTHANQHLNKKPDDYLLVAFIGQQRQWETTWKSQSDYLKREFINRSNSNWGSVACIDPDDVGLTMEALKALHMNRITRLPSSYWWGESDNSTNANYCEQGITNYDINVSNWIKLNKTDNDGNIKQYYFNSITQKVIWTKPLEYRDYYHNSLNKQTIGIHKSNPVESSCFLRRLSSCRETVLEQCKIKKCTNILLIRPDLAISENTTQNLIYNWIKFFNKNPSKRSILVRLRCISKNEKPRTKIFPASICHGVEGHMPCPKDKFTLDDQVALIPSNLASDFFRTEFNIPPKKRNKSFACPYTIGWPEGRLTDTLLSYKIPIKEFIGFQTIIQSSHMKSMNSNSSMHHPEYDF